MDIFTEIYKLPQFLYVFTDRELILGGGGTYDKENRMPMDRLFYIWETIKSYYEEDNLSDEQKGEFADNVRKMMFWCAGEPINPEELEKIINGLSDEEKHEIEWQIDMYKLGREYYRDYRH